MSEVEEVKHPYESHEGEYYYTLTVPKEVAYPTITIVHEIPRTRVKPTSESDKVQMIPNVSTLNPASEVFQPRKEEDEENAEDEVQNLSGEQRTNENLPVNEQNDSVEDLPVGDPGVEEDETVQEEPEQEENVETEWSEVRKEERIEEEKSVEDESGTSEVNVVQEEREPGVRRSTRDRTEPDRLSYKSLGNPLTLVMHSILNSLDQAFTQALDFTKELEFTPFPDISQLTSV